MTCGSHKLKFFGTLRGYPAGEVLILIRLGARRRFATESTAELATGFVVRPAGHRFASLERPLSRRVRTVATIARPSVLYG